MRKKVTVVGGGFVGSTTAQRILDAGLADIVRKGRWEFLTQFPSIVDFGRRADLADPADPATFARCALDFSERHTHASAYSLHQDLLKLRVLLPDSLFGSFTLSDVDHRPDKLDIPA